jgi:hypothetical protein
LKLYWSGDQLNDISSGISGVTVQLSDGVDVMTFTEDQEIPGLYLSSEPFMATAGKTYRLILSADHLADTAYASMSGVSPLEAIQIVSADGYYRLEYQQSSPPSMMEVLYDWSANAQYGDQYGANKAAEVFYSLDNIDAGKIFAPDKINILFPHQTEIIRRKYSLSEDHQRFIRSLLMETEWRGGFFDTEQGNVPTNFNHGVRGWFAVCMVANDTTFFQ